MKAHSSRPNTECAIVALVYKVEQDSYFYAHAHLRQLHEMECCDVGVQLLHCIRFIVLYYSSMSTTLSRYG